VLIGRLKLLSIPSTKKIVAIASRTDGHFSKRHPMRIATYNIQNLFRRAKVLNLATTAVAMSILDDIQRLNELLAKATYSAQEKDDIKRLLMKHDVENEAKRPFFIQQARGKLYSQTQGTPLGTTNTRRSRQMRAQGLLSLGQLHPRSLAHFHAPVHLRCDLRCLPDAPEVASDLHSQVAEMAARQSRRGFQPRRRLRSEDPGALPG
jgi:hypothetical protein